jgi:hypothetical protein
MNTLTKFRWAEIGAEIQRPRRDCQKRYRVLWAHAQELGLTRDMLAELYIDSDSDSDADSDDEEEDDEEETYYVKKTKAKNGRRGNTKTVQTVETKKPTHSHNDYYYYKKGNNSNAKEGTHHKSRSSHSNSSNKKKTTKKRTVVSSSSSSSSSDSDSSETQQNQYQNQNQNQYQNYNHNHNQKPADFATEYWAQRRYFYDNVQHGMYPNQKVLRPDRFFSESDCRVLSGLEARFRANKWLHIQADFCNATGRMVDAEVLKRKFYEA